MTGEDMWMSIRSRMQNLVLRQAQDEVSTATARTMVLILSWSKDEDHALSVTPSSRYAAAGAAWAGRYWAASVTYSA
jgi:hypothetical protein